jgi:hypothetical protein
MEELTFDHLQNHGEDWRGFVEIFWRCRKIQKDEFKKIN